jgi:peptidyl-prolyl cis-trans isomerase SurA
MQHGSSRVVRALLRGLVSHAPVAGARVRSAALLLPLFLLPLSSEGQQGARPPIPDAERVDRVAAVVGDSVVLYSQVLEGVLRVQARGGTVPGVSDRDARQAFEREILEGLINEQLLLQAAGRDTTFVVQDERVDGALRMAWDDQIRRFGSETALRDALSLEGLSVQQYRNQLRDEIRRDLIVQTFIQSRQADARNIVVEEGEVVAFFEAQREILTNRPATITYEQAFVQPEPGDSAMAAARAEAERILGLLREGGDFAALARQFSQDPGSRPLGGDLGWYRRGSDLVREFEDAAFMAREGQIVGPIETIFGAHIIRVDRVRGAERRIQHILIGAGIEEADGIRAREEANEIRRALEAGASIRTFTERQQAQGVRTSMEVPVDQLDRLPPALGAGLRTATAGQLIGPVEFPLENGQSTWGVFRVVERRDAGAYTLDDLRTEIRERLRQEKFEERLIADLRARTYVLIRI